MRRSGSKVPKGHSKAALTRENPLNTRARHDPAFAAAIEECRKIGRMVPQGLVELVAARIRREKIVAEVEDELRLHRTALDRLRQDERFARDDFAEQQRKEAEEARASA